MLHLTVDNIDIKITHNDVVSWLVIISLIKTIIYLIFSP